MKFIEKRTDIASTINFHKMPIVKMDLANKSEYGLVSEKVNIDNGTFRDGNPYFIHADIRIYRDEQRFTFHRGCTCLHSDFGYYDIEEMLEWANAPIIKADSDFCLVVIDSETKRAWKPMILHTGKRIDANCSSPLTIEMDEQKTEKIMAEIFIMEAGFNKEA